MPNGCWHWTSTIDPSGYGKFKYLKPDGKWENARAHRVSYILYKGPIPEGLTIDHTCHTRQGCCGGISCHHRRCVNPDHLEAVTSGVNSHRGNTQQANNSAKSHCIHGHPLNDENTKFDYNPDGSIKKRTCMVCRRKRYNEVYYATYYERKKAKWAAAKLAAHSANLPSELLLSPTVDCG